MKGVELRQVGEREGAQGNVRDTFELLVNGTLVLALYHSVEYSLQETPLMAVVPREAAKLINIIE